MVSRVGIVVLAAVAGAMLHCNGSRGSAGSPPKHDDGGVAGAAGEGPSETPPPELSLPHGKVFSLDTSTKEYSTSIAGSTATLVSVLASAGGQRRLELRDGGKARVLAPAAWNLPPHAAVAPDGGVLACWNTLTGRASNDQMPHPTLGMTLSCVLAVGMKPGGAVQLPTGSAKGVWLVAVRRDAEAFVVRYVRDETGWLFGSPAAEDGIYDIGGDGESFSEPSLVARGSLVP
jgi:hypothetical protein